jgi:uncharacterized protein YabN with tetrapyrrole methylase and pyrophosphatase domain
MGNSVATNKVEQDINEVFNVTNEVISSCGQRGIERQAIDFDNLDVSGTINVNTDWSQVVKVNQTCTQTTNIKTKLDNKLKDKISQIAKSTTEALSAGKSASNNYAKLMEKLALNVSNVTSNKCIQTQLQSASIKIKNSKAKNINVVANWNQEMQGLFKCVQGTDSVENIKQELINTLDQSATAKTEGIAGILGAIYIVAIIVIGVVVFYFIKSGGANKAIDASSGSGGSSSALSSLE